MPSEKTVRLTAAQISALLALPEAELHHALLLLRLPLFPGRPAPLGLRLSGARLDALMILPEAELRKNLEMLMQSLGDFPYPSTSDFCSGCRIDPPLHLFSGDDFNPFLQGPENDRAGQGDDGTKK
jgi:hypothetical protein